MDINDVDIHARSLLHDELLAIGIDVPVVIWPDEKNAYLDGDEDVNAAAYSSLAAHYREHKHELSIYTDEQVDDEMFVKTALYTRYEVLCNKIEDTLKEQTWQSKSLDSEVRMVSGEHRVAGAGFSGTAEPVLPAMSEDRYGVHVKCPLSLDRGLSLTPKSRDDRPLDRATHSEELYLPEQDKPDTCLEYSEQHLSLH